MAMLRMNPGGDLSPEVARDMVAQAVGQLTAAKLKPWLDKGYHVAKQMKVTGTPTRKADFSLVHLISAIKTEGFLSGYYREAGVSNTFTVKSVKDKGEQRYISGFVNIAEADVEPELTTSTASDCLALDNPLANPPMQEVLEQSGVGIANTLLVAFSAKQIEDLAVKQLPKIKKDLAGDQLKKWAHVTGTAGGVAITAGEVWLSALYKPEWGNAVLISGAIATGFRLLAAFMPDAYKNIKPGMSGYITMDQVENRKRNGGVSGYLQRPVRPVRRQRRLPQRRMAGYLTQQKAKEAPRQQDAQNPVSATKMSLHSRNAQLHSGAGQKLIYS